MADFSWCGTYPVWSERLNKWQRGVDIVGRITFNNFEEILSGPDEFFVLSFDIIFTKVSCVTVEKINNSSVCGPKNVWKSIFAGVILFASSGPIPAKKELNPSAIFCAPLISSWVLLLKKSGMFSFLF